MTQIRVNPASVKKYGTSASAMFGDMHKQLVQLVHECVEVHYFGPNSVQFKKECGQLAAAFANALHKDMAAMAAAVQSSTSNIAKSLGGAAIVIAVDNRPVTPPAPKVVDYVDVDTAALQGLVPVVTKHFTSIRSTLEKNLGELKGTDWTGNAKTMAVTEVGGFTNNAIKACDEAKGSITKYINAQLEAALAADR